MILYSASIDYEARKNLFFFYEISYIMINLIKKTMVLFFK